MNRGDFAAAVDRHYPGFLQRLTLVLHDAEEAKDVARGARSRDFGSVCMIGIVYEAAEVIVE